MGPNFYFPLIVKKKNSFMKYWDGDKRFLQIKIGNSSIEITEGLLSCSDYDLNPDLMDILKSCPKRKLSLEQDF